MSEFPPPADEHADEHQSGEARDPEETRLVIAVARSGGIAGISRRWLVEPDPAEAAEWITMIEGCPWDAAAATAPGADRFMWVIRVRTPSDRLEQELPDSELDGPWRKLVDAVRAASA